MEIFSNILGIIGVVLMIIAYLLLQIGKLRADDLSFPLANLLGALMILFSLTYAWNLPAALIEIAWAIISVVGIAKILLSKYKHASRG